MAVRSPRRANDDYVVRTYEPADLEQYLSLYETVFERARDADWVRWRYGGPYTDRVRMVVAEREGELVGAEPFISLPLRAGGTDVLALQPADVMVHPDHRRNGLMTRMTAFAVEHYEGRADLFYNFPNDAARLVHLRLGWRDAGETATAYRVHSPSAVTDQLDVPPSTDGVARGWYERYDGVVDTATTAIRDWTPTVRRVDGVPADVLGRLYDRRHPDRLHAPRTAAFYRWRLGRSPWDLTTYVAESRGRPVAALVVCTERREGTTYAKLLDALPLADPDPVAMERLALAAVTDHRSADLVAVAGDTLPAAVTERLGFLRDDALPLSLVTSPDPVVVRPFGTDDDWSVGGRRLTDRENWELSLIVQDTCI